MQSLPYIILAQRQLIPDLVELIMRGSWNDFDIIVASQLLNAHSYLGQAIQGQSGDAVLPTPDAPQIGAISLAGASVTGSVAFALVWLIHWTRGGGSSSAGKGRMTVFLIIVILFATVSYAYMRRQWLQYLRQQSLAEISNLAVKAQELDSVIAAALTLVQEVELVSRGYRISVPLPPISRLEDRSQSRRCARLRKQLRLCFAEVIPRY